MVPSGRAPGPSRCPGLRTPPGLGSGWRRPPTQPPAGPETDQARRRPPRRAQREPDSGPRTAPDLAGSARASPAARRPRPARLTCPERRAHIARPRRPLRRRRRQARPRRSGCRPCPRPPPPEALPGPAPSAPALPGRRGPAWQPCAGASVAVSGMSPGRCPRPTLRTVGQTACSPGLDPRISTPDPEVAPRTAAFYPPSPRRPLLAGGGLGSRAHPGLLEPKGGNPRTSATRVHWGLRPPLRPIRPSHLQSFRCLPCA